MVIGNVKYLRREIRRARRAKTRPASFVQDRGPVLRSAKRDLRREVRGQRLEERRGLDLHTSNLISLTSVPHLLVQDRGPVLRKSRRAVPARCAQVLRSDASRPRSWQRPERAREEEREILIFTPLTSSLLPLIHPSL